MSDRFVISLCRWYWHDSQCRAGQRYRFCDKLLSSLILLVHIVIFHLFFCQREKNLKASKRLWIKWGWAKLRVFGDFSSLTLSTNTCWRLSEFIGSQANGKLSITFFGHTNSFLLWPARVGSCLWWWKINEWVRKIWRKGFLLNWIMLKDYTRLSGDFCVFLRTHENDLSWQ